MILPEIGDQSVYFVQVCINFLLHCSPVRKSIKDRLGPVGGKSESPSDRNSRERSSQKDVQGRKDTVRDRLGRKVKQISMILRS